MGANPNNKRSRLRRDFTVGTFAITATFLILLIAGFFGNRTIEVSSEPYSLPIRIEMITIDGTAKEIVSNQQGVKFVQTTSYTVDFLGNVVGKSQCELKPFLDEENLERIRYFAEQTETVANAIDNSFRNFNIDLYIGVGIWEDFEETETLPCDVSEWVSQIQFSKHSAIKTSTDGVTVLIEYSSHNTDGQVGWAKLPKSFVDLVVSRGLNGLTLSGSESATLWADPNQAPTTISSIQYFVEDPTSAQKFYEYFRAPLGNIWYGTIVETAPIEQHFENVTYNSMQMLLVP